MSGVYLDASAAVKLLIEEDESQPLDDFLTGWPLRVSSELLQVELTCVCHRRRMDPAHAEALLAGLRLLPLSAAVLRGAGRRFTPPQRALDALHLAAAEQARDHLERFVSYDAEQLAAASALGWHVETPVRAT